MEADDAVYVTRDRLAAAVREALAELTEAEAACEAAEVISWPYRSAPEHARRAAAAMSRWQRANLALSDARCAAAFGENWKDA